MDDKPPLAPGFVRIQLLIEKPGGATPGELVSATGIDPEHVGVVLIDGHQGLVDVAEAHGEQARKGLDRIGITQVTHAQRPPPTWSWLRITVGRNHGLTIGQLRKLLRRFGASRLGQIHINNTFTLVGLRDDEIDQVEAQLADHRINGVAARPARPATMRRSAAFQPRDR